MTSVSRAIGLSRRRYALLAALLAASAALGPVAAGAAAKSKGAAKGKAGESLKLVVEPKEVSLTDALQDEFFVEVSGHSSKHAQLEVFLDASTKPSCAANEPTETQMEDTEEENPAQSLPGHNVEKYPATLGTNFTGSFDWDTNMLLLEKEVVKPGTKLICAYLTAPEAIQEIQPTAEEKRIAEETESYAEPKRVPVKPLLTAQATLKVIDGKVPKAKK